MFFKRVLSSYISTSNTWDYLIVCLWILTVLLFISVILEKVSVTFILWICLVFNDLEHFPMFFIYISSVNYMIQVFLFSYSNYSIFLVKNKLKKRVDEQFHSLEKVTVIRPFWFREHQKKSILFPGSGKKVNRWFWVGETEINKSDPVLLGLDNSLESG